MTHQCSKRLILTNTWSIGRKPGGESVTGESITGESVTEIDNRGTLKAEINDFNSRILHKRKEKIWKLGAVNARYGI